MSKVLVIDTNLKQLDPVHPGEARVLLDQGKAAIYRKFPFVIVMKEEIKAEPTKLRLKIDPGSKTTGMAIVNDETGEVVSAIELEHHGEQVKKSLKSRSDSRRGRRSRKKRHRRCKYAWFIGLHKNDKRKKRGRPSKKDWFPPSLMSRVLNIETWIKRLTRYAPITGFSLELNKFDTQKLENSEISGVEYQKGTLHDYNVWEYLLERDDRTCQYCGAKNMPLERDHIIPKSRGGSNRVSNLVVACHSCNQKKGNMNAEEFLKDKPEKLKKIKSQLKKPLLNAAVMNATRYKLLEVLKEFGLPIETGTGSQTKFNRTSQGLPKSHWADAACIGKKTPQLKIEDVRPLIVKAKGRGSRQICQTDKHGFPKSYRKRDKVKFGFQTGDIVRAVVPKGKNKGTHIGRVIVRDKPSFGIMTKKGRVDGINSKYIERIHRSDGYEYQTGRVGYIFSSSLRVSPVFGDLLD